MRLQVKFLLIIFLPLFSLFFYQITGLSDFVKYHHSGGYSENPLRIFYLLFFMSFSVFFLIALFLNFHIASQIRKLSAAVDSINRGHFNVSLPDQYRSDEIGDLVRNFQSIIVSMKLAVLMKRKYAKLLGNIKNGNKK